MKIGPPTSPADMPPAQDMRRRLGMETNFDSTLRELEGAMWPGSRAGSQPTRRLPSQRAGDPGFDALSARVEKHPSITTSEAFAASRQLPAAHLSVETTIAGTPRNTPAADAGSHEFPLLPDLALPTGTAPALTSGGMEEDTTPATAPHASTPDVEPPEQRMQAIVTWTDGVHGDELVIRQVPDRHAGEILAQVRRHGLLPRRITIDGTTTEHPYREGETP